MSQRWLALLLTFVSLQAAAQFRLRDNDDPDAPKWQEEALRLPAFPQPENLLPFYVSEMTSHRFMIDGSTLQVGQDRVVRYALIVQTSGGATNITYEGIRCDTREYRLYAAGRRDGTWSETRTSAWRPIENKPINRHHAALSRDLFCPNGVAIFTPAEGLDALRRGKHPDAL